MIYVSHLIEDEELAPILTKYECGLESIDFSISMVLDEMDASLKSYEKRLEKMGNPKLLLHGPFLDINPIAYDKYVREITLRRYNECYQAAKALGAKKIVYHTCYLPKVYMLIGWAERVIEFYEWFLQDKDDSVQIVMENVQDPEIEPVLQVAESIKHPAFGLCLDVGHANCYAKQPVLDWEKALSGHIRHFHLHDNDGAYDRHGPIGTGNIPFEEILSPYFAEQGTARGQATMTIENNSAEHIVASLEWLKAHGYIG